MPEHDAVNHPRHYAAHPRFTCECIELTRHMGFAAGNALKYLWRFEQKNGDEDLQKAIWYLRDLQFVDRRVWLDDDSKRIGTRLYMQHVAPHLQHSNLSDLAIMELCTEIENSDPDQLELDIPV